MTRHIEFDIALSFAGEDRGYVDVVANLLRDRGVTVFYDRFEETSLWGKNLYDHLSDVYQNKARFTVMFISEAYARKLWPNHERQAMQARAFQEAQEYILPARFDDTDVPGILPTIGYISLADRKPEEFVELIINKLVDSGATVPSEQVRRSFSTIRPVPRVQATQLRVRVTTDRGRPIEGANVVALADNNTTLEDTTNAEGFVDLLVRTRRTYTLLGAHPDHPGAVYDRVNPTDDLEVLLPEVENIGSVIIHSTGYIRGLKGRLNPILDSSNRTYIYAENIAVNGGLQQPVCFTVNEPFELEDCNGMTLLVTVKFIAGRTALLQYIRPVEQGD